MGKRRIKKLRPPKQDTIWMEGHKLNEKTGELEPVRYKIKGKKI